MGLFWVFTKPKAMMWFVSSFYTEPMFTFFANLSHNSIEVFSTVSPRATIRIEGRPLADKWPGERPSYRWVVLQVDASLTFVEDFLGFRCHGLYVLDFPQLQIGEPTVLKLAATDTEADAH